MRATIVYDNRTRRPDLEADWGFACYLEAQGHRLLFDTGGSGRILLHNLARLNIDPTAVDTVVISHNHFDHIGGLAAFLEQNNRVKAVLPPSLRGVRHAREVVFAGQPEEIYPGIYTTGELENVEQSLVVETSRGMLVFVGCAHPDMQKILQTARQFGRLYGIVGGLHDFEEYELLQGLDFILPTHCTRHREELKTRYPSQYREGGVGTFIEIE